METLQMDTKEYKNNSDVVVVYCRYRIVNGRKVFPKKAKAFRLVFRKQSA